MGSVAGAGPVVTRTHGPVPTAGVPGVQVRLGLDLWLMIFAAALMVIYQALLTESVRWGLERSPESLTLEAYREVFYWQILTQFFVNI